MSFGLGLGCVGHRAEGLRLVVSVLSSAVLNLASVTSPNTRTDTRDGSSIAHPISTQGWAERGGYGVRGVGGLEMLWAEWSV